MFRPMSESRKEEFQKYLEKSGVIDTLTKVLVNLYECPEKPPNAINFIKESMGPAPPGGDVEKLQAKVKEQQAALEAKEKEILELKQKLADLTEAQKKAE
uniref:c-Myc-binding protein n=1 Tax=Amorphochlora amoebiformis TaxID=1561963 RepID=A0A7S0DTL0_9EUKA